MIDFIPYFAGMITLLFSAGFAYAVGGGFNKEEKQK